jgi:hypothetical protein
MVSIKIMMGVKTVGVYVHCLNGSLYLAANAIYIRFLSGTKKFETLTELSVW